METRTALAVEKGIGREFRNEARELRQEVAELRARLAALNPERPADDHRIMLA